MPDPDHLATVDVLCRLALAAQRLGCRVHLVDVDPDLRALIDLAGVGDVLADCPVHPTRPIPATMLGRDTPAPETYHDNHGSQSDGRQRVTRRLGRQSEGDR